MTTAKSLQRLDVEEPIDDSPTLGHDTAPDDDGAAVADMDVAPGRYDDAAPADLTDYCENYTFPTFVDSVLDAIGTEFTAGDARLVDDLEDADDEDVHFGALLVLPDETLLFLGSDPTAKDAIPWFAFAIEPFEPIPAPGTADDALSLLRPPSVQDVLAEDDFLPMRHGEWFLIPTTMIPAGTVVQPGVADEPYGPSPLGNHVPREFAFTVRDDVFMERFRESTSAPETVGTVSEAIEWTHRQISKPFAVKGAPDWADIRHWAGDVLVRHSVRHRDEDHFVEDCGDQWHVAVTHDIEVYTGDEVATDVHIDYHGRRRQR